MLFDDCKIKSLKLCYFEKVENNLFLQFLYKNNMSIILTARW